MDFARKQLEKYGWTDGKGLGKHENGISEALKPKLKRSVTGVGHDAASDFTEHWWSQLYDKAAGNVQVEDVNGKTKKIKAKDTENFEITNSTWRLNKKKKGNNDGEYSEYFVKKAVLTNGGRKVENVNVSDSEDDSSGEKKDVLKLTDEELFAACGGRTAHKGARHGLKAIGKLARIAQQEQTLLIQPKFEGYSHAKKLKQDISTNDLQVVEDMNLDSDVDTSIMRKKKKKKRKHCVSQNSESENVELADNMAESKQSPLPDNEIKESNEQSVPSEEIDETVSRKSKKSKRKKECLDVNDINTEITDDVTIAKKTKKIKQKGHEDDKQIVAMETDCTEKCEEQIVVDNGTKKKRKKKKHNAM